MMRSVAVIGGSLAGLSAARALRNQGFDGRLSIVGAEAHRPYDRPPLSKEFLAGGSCAADLALEADGEDLGAHWRFEVSATGLRPGSRAVELSDGTTLMTDGVVLATGAAPRLLQGMPAMSGCHVLRTLDDAIALREDLQPGRRLVIVGAGFIGAEVASTANRLGLDVTVVEASSSPLAGSLGTEMGAVVAGLHADHGVRLRCGVGVAGLTGTGHVTGVELADGRVLPAEVVLVGVGAVPNTDWLEGSGLELAGGVVCDSLGATNIPGVVAVGDCASWYEPQLGHRRRVEHWTTARERAAQAVSTLLADGATRKPTRPPYVWSDQYGVRIQFAGRIAGYDSVTVEQGTTQARDFVAVYRRGSSPIAVLAMEQCSSFMRWRRALMVNEKLPESGRDAAVAQDQPVAEAAEFTGFTEAPLEATA